MEHLKAGSLHGYSCRWLIVMVRAAGGKATLFIFVCVIARLSSAC